VFVPRSSSTSVATWFSQTKGKSVVRVTLGITNRVFGEENPTPCTIVIVPGSVSYHVQNSLQNDIISIQRNQSTNHNIYIRNNSVYKFSTSPLG
jgi:hypothetical protein